MLTTNRLKSTMKCKVQVHTWLDDMLDSECFPYFFFCQSAFILVSTVTFICDFSVSVISGLRCKSLLLIQIVDEPSLLPHLRHLVIVFGKLDYISALHSYRGPRNTCAVFVHIILGCRAVVVPEGKGSPVLRVRLGPLRYEGCF